MGMTRKEFLASLVKGTAVGAVAAGALAACGGDDDGAATIDGPPGACSPTATIGTNHGHTLVVSAADIAAAADKTYDIMGSSVHTHSVTLTAAHFASLAAGTMVMTVSTTGSAHTHSITVRCA